MELLFAPSVEEMYPAGAVTWVTVEGLSDKLDGRSRPGHFRGVTTVVAKLFHIVEPDVAFFGQKDAAQLAIIRRMVRDLNFPVEIVGLPDCAGGGRIGHEFAQCVSRSATAKTGAGSASFADTGEKHCGRLASANAAETSGCGSRRVCGRKIGSPRLFRNRGCGQPRSSRNCEAGCLVAVAAFVGATRLIDNIQV